MSSADEARPVLALIDSLVANLVRDFAEGRIDGAIVMIARTKANTAFATSGAVIAGPATSQRKFSIRSLASLARLFAVISACYELLCKNKIVSQRQLYYMLVHLFPSQYALNDTVLDVSATLAVPRYALNVGAATRGVVAGSVCIGVPQSRVDVDCRFVGSTGWPIPGRIDIVKNLQMSSNARYIVVIEKYGIFQRLCDDRFFNFVPSILVCGKGQPSVATRLFVMRLEQQFQLPVLGLVDFNPHGLAILHTYRQGSVRSCIEGSDYVSNVRWLGLRGSQIKDLDFEYSIGLCGESFTARDHSVVASLRASVERNNLGERYMEEIGEMERLGKHELQWLYGHPEGLSYLSKTFLPMSIMRQDFL